MGLFSVIPGSRGFGILADLARSRHPAYAKAMLDAPVRRLLAFPMDRVAGTFARVGVGATTITLFGFMMGVAAAVLIVDEQYIRALFFLALNRLADILDGIMARARGPTPLGAYLDSTLDVIIYALIPFAFALARQQDALAATFLLVGFMVALIPVVASRAFSAQARVDDFVLCGHTEHFVVIVLLCVAERWTFTPLAYFYGALCFLSCAITIIASVIRLRAAAKP